MEFDEKLIKTSIVSQYHFLPHEVDELSHKDYYQLVEGLNGDSMLADVIRIRTETDPKKYLAYGKAASIIRVKWQLYLESLEK